MLQAFLVSFREAFQCSVLLTLFGVYLRDFDKKLRHLLSGVVAAAFAGAAIGFNPGVGEAICSQDTWTFWRYVAESLLFYSGILFAFVNVTPGAACEKLGMFVVGFLLCFFEARAGTFVIRDMALMSGTPWNIFLISAVGGAIGFLAFTASMRYKGKFRLSEIFTFPSLIVTAGVIKFAFGGVGELEKGNILTAMQKGLGVYVTEGVRHVQSALMISAHQFMETPFAGLADYLAGDRTPMTLAFLFIIAPPLFLLIRLFGRSAPPGEESATKAAMRLNAAAFRKDLVSRTVPLLSALVVLMFMLHQANLTLNPLYDPAPNTVREENGGKLLRLPVSCKSGDYSDGKVKKFVYYYGNKQIIFLAIQKPDGSMGVALDECEICRPAPWNKDAWGYAQRGGNLVCKYCMTPIAIPTINNPGGCNPIPIPFRLEDENITITLDDLIRIYESTQKLETKGTHL